jgi:hypothetical protein
MRKSIVTLSLSLICVIFASAQNIQTRSTASATAETSTTANTSGINLENETRVSAELEKSLDVRKANVGDEVVLKTTQAIKSDGRVIADKGARLFGRVTDVAKNSNSGPSRIGILFNRLERGQLAMQIRASIMSVTNVGTSARLSDDNSASTRTTSSTGSSTLIGAGGLISSTSAVLGSTVNATADTVDTSTTGLGTIQISQSSNTSVQGESVLSLRGGNLRLEKGTKFNLVVTQSANAGTAREE